MKLRPWVSAMIGLASVGLAACASHRTPLQLAVSPCHDTKVTLYFERGSETLTAGARQIVSLTAKRLQGCHVRELTLVGLADPTGSPEINLPLSTHRADDVLAAFVRDGLPVPKYTLIGLGAKGALTPDGAVEPLRRQVDVTVVIAR
jgi:outer membrane protein OmpA-like peptidoglycan-associated protein